MNRTSGYSYAIVGTGAVGGFYGACLQRAGAEVHFLLHRDFEQVKQQGLVVESTLGNFVLPQVWAYSDVRQMPACDVVIVALKTTQNHLLPQLLPPIVKPAGAVLVLQNGLGVEAEVADLVGQTSVLGGLCFICSNKLAPGHIRHLDYGQIKLGAYQADDRPAGITDPMQRLAQDLQAAGIPVELATDLLLARWQKLVWNIPYNGLSVVLNARTDELMAQPQTRALVEAIMAEVSVAAAACDRQITPDFIQTMLDYTLKMKPYRTSMKIDYDEGRALEVETMFGNPLRAAESRGVKLPRIEMLYQQLKFLAGRHLN